MKIGYQGTKGSYSEAAIHNCFDEFKALGFETFAEVFEALKKDKVDAAVLPFENTIAGSIARNYDLLLKYDFNINAEIFFQIKHNLLGNSNDIKKIKKVYSHPHAIEQCRVFLQKNNIKAIAEYDTAGAAKIVKHRGKNDEAAIASDLSAEIYKLKIIAKDIQSNKNNTTRFFLLGKEDYGEKEKTSIVFKTKHYPGALVNCLQRLAKNNVNLTKLESRPVPENPWVYYFFADFTGGTDDKDIKLALAEMEAAAEFVRVLGSYKEMKKNGHT